MNEILNNIKDKFKNYNHWETESVKQLISNLKTILNSKEVTKFCQSFNFKYQVFKGVGNYPLSPWIAFLSNEKEYSIQKGYYICYLVDIYAEKFFLTIQSGTENLSMSEIRENAELGKQLLGTYCDFTLGSSTGRPFKYIEGASYSKEYIIGKYASSMEQDLITLVQLFKDTMINSVSNTFDYTDALINEAILKSEDIMEAELITLEEIDPPVRTNLPRKKRGVRVSKRNYVSQMIIDMKNGITAEELVLTMENLRLQSLGISSNKYKAERKSKSGDGDGYDILSYDIVDEEVVKRFIEVKGTVGGINQSFFVSSNEVRMSKKYGERYFTYRVFELKKHPKFYMVQGPFEDNFVLEPISYRVYNK